MGKHTPGPWAWEQKEEQGWGVEGIYGSDGTMVLGLGPGWDSNAVMPDEIDRELIITAPELLESVKELLEAWSCPYDDVHTGCTCPKCKAKAVIAKATKET